MKRKLKCDLTSDFEDDLFIPRPAKRLSMCDNTPKQARDEKKRLLKTCRKKLRQLENPEASLHRSLLINNMYRQLQSELKQDKPSKSYGYAFNPKCPFGYGAGPKEVANRRKLAKLREVLDRKVVGSVSTQKESSLYTGRINGHPETIRLVSDTKRSVLDTKKVTDCDNNTNLTTVAMDCQASDSVCHVIEDGSDTEEIDVCTVDEGESCPLYAQSAGQCAGQMVIPRDSELCTQEFSQFQTVSSPYCISTPSQGTYSAVTSNQGTLVSELAALGDERWTTSEHCNVQGTGNSQLPCTKHSYQGPSQRHYLAHTDSQYITPYINHTDTIYTQGLHSFCLSSSPFYPSVTPQDYLNTAYSASFSRFYPGGFPTQLAATPGSAVIPNCHPTASMVSCT